MNTTNATPRIPLDSLSNAILKAGLSLQALSTVRGWLADQLVAHEYAKLGQGGHTNTEIPLRKVFVDLPVSASPSGRTHSNSRPLFLQLFLASNPLNLKESFIKKKSGELVPSNTGSNDEDDDDAEDTDEAILMLSRNGEWVENYPKLGATILIGGPGQGKSTLGQLACQLHRAALLKPGLSFLRGAQREIVQSFETESSNANGSKQPSLKLPKNPLLPLQIALPDLSTWLTRQNPDLDHNSVPAIIRFIADLPSAKDHSLNAESLMALASHLPSLLVLDGFDEIGSTQDRERIVAVANELLAALANNGSSTQVLATTRPQGYANEFSQIGIRFKTLYLAQLQKSEALVYAGKLIETKIPGADERQKALAQLREAAAEPATERLLTTPLQVTILSALVQQLGRAPRERWNLFSRYFDYTYDREVERNTYASALLAEHRSHIDRIHARVALLLQVEAERHGGAAARMTKKRLEEVIDEVLTEDEVSKTDRESLVREIATAAEMRLVFLVEPEPGSFGYEIRSLQEFMAARALTLGRDSEVEARLLQIAKAPMFRNVALFGASRLFSEGSPLRDILASHICSKLDADPEDALARLTRTGAMFALETLEEGAVISQPKRARALTASAAGLLELPPGLEHIRLARTANDDTSSTLRDAIEKRFKAQLTSVRTDEFASWVCLIDTMSRNQTWAYEVGNEFWSTVNRLPS
jgi:hypothetical protein